MFLYIFVSLYFSNYLYFYKYIYTFYFLFFYNQSSYIHLWNFGLDNVSIGNVFLSFFKVLYFWFNASMLFNFTCQYRCDIFFRQRPKTRLRPSKFEFDLLLRVCHIIYNSNLHHDYKTWNFINKILSLYFKLF